MSIEQRLKILEDETNTFKKEIKPILLRIRKQLPYLYVSSIAPRSPPDDTNKGLSET
jgi:hypothetical protein